MDQPGLSSSNSVSHIIENPASPASLQGSPVNVNRVFRVGIDILLGLGMSSYDRYVELSSEDEPQAEKEIAIVLDIIMKMNAFSASPGGFLVQFGQKSNE